MKTYKNYKDFAQEREEAESDDCRPVIAFIIGMVFSFNAFGYVLEYLS